MSWYENASEAGEGLDTIVVFLAQYNHKNGSIWKERVRFREVLFFPGEVWISAMKIYTIFFLIIV